MPTKTLIQILIGVCLLSSQLALSAQSLKSNEFTLVEHYNVGGEGGWDLLTFDTKHHRLFVSRSTHVQVIDADSGKVIGDIYSGPIRQDRNPSNLSWSVRLTRSCMTLPHSGARPIVFRTC